MLSKEKLLSGDIMPDFLGSGASEVGIEVARYTAVDPGGRRGGRGRGVMKG